MIAKLETGNGFGGALRYDVRAGKGTAKELARVLDAYGVSFDFDEKGDLLINPKQVGFDFRQQTMGYTGEGVIRKPVYHWVLSYHPDDKVSEEQMQKDAKEFLERIGFDDTQYVMTVHYDKKHHHLHIVTNIVNNQGKRIPTMGLIDKAHKAAYAITEKNGYIVGEKMKKENVIEDKMHKPHERAREIIEPMIREALAKSTSLSDFQEKLIMDYGIMCNFTVAKDGNRGRLSFCYEYEGQQHSFNGSSVARDLSFGYVDKAIKAQEKYRDIKAGYSSVIPPVSKELVSIRNNCYQLYKDTSDARIAVKAETTEKYNELRSLWKQFHELNDTRKNEKDTVKVTEAIGGMLMLLNPLVGLSVIFLAKISGDVRESSQRELKKQLLQKIESVRNEITDLAAKKAQLDIKKSECLKDYLDAKQMLQEYKDGLKTVDKAILDMKSEKPKITAASLQKAFGKIQPGTIHYGLPPSSLTFVIRQDIIESSNIQDLNLKLLKDDLHLTPVMNASGLVSDLKITQRGKDTLFSEVTDYQETIDTVMAWGRLTNMPTVQPRQEQEETQRVSQGRGYTHSRKEEPAEKESVTTGYKIHR